jgi:hypothetical protein
VEERIQREGRGLKAPANPLLADDHGDPAPLQVPSGVVLSKTKESLLLVRPVSKPDPVVVGRFVGGNRPIFTRVDYFVVAIIVLALIRLSQEYSKMQLAVGASLVR